MDIRSGHIEQAIRNLWPDRGFILDGDGLSGLRFLDRENGKPTKAELQKIAEAAAAVAAYQAGPVYQAQQELIRLDRTMTRSHEELLLKVGIIVHGTERAVLERKQELRGIVAGSGGPVLANGLLKVAE